MSFFCLNCSKDMKKPQRICPYCGSVQYEEPSPAIMTQAASLMRSKTGKRGVLYDYSDAELLTTGLYPDDEAYRMSLISNILNDNKKK